MMDSNFHPGHVRLQDLIDELITQYGAFRVTRMLVATLFARLRRYPRGRELSDHLRRDIGLPPRDPPPGFRDLMM